MIDKTLKPPWGEIAIARRMAAISYAFVTSEIPLFAGATGHLRVAETAPEGKTTPSLSEIG
ncbi:hypothetical protein AB0I77_29255 [Streptomyces sp. NPDC050619]|uniref:hypothetical protein n=1 Tax=Streptomyces sp. NPDC050619 TaxID=3157214 RepID=UPI003433BCE1